MERHAIRVTIEPEGYTRFEYRCPYEPTQPDRPCRPRDADSKPDPDSLDCWVVEWLNNVGLDETEQDGELVSDWIEFDYHNSGEDVEDSQLVIEPPG